MMGGHHSKLPEKTDRNQSRPKTGKANRFWNCMPWSKNKTGGDDSDLSLRVSPIDLNAKSNPEKSKTNKVFTFRAPTGISSVTEDGQISIFYDCNEIPCSSPILRKNSSTKSFDIKTFSRPLTHEMISVYDAALTSDPSKQGFNQLPTSPSSIGKPYSSALSELPPTPSSNYSKKIPSKKDASTKTRKLKKTSASRPAKHEQGQNQSKLREGCCKPLVPPVYIDYTSCSSRKNSGAGGQGGNLIIDRLKNVDVIEELQYQVPGECGDNSDEDFDYYYQCPECGDMEPCKNANGDGKGTCTKPVTYSRRQRFNFAHKGNSDDDEGPPFSWAASDKCPCVCCRAGLRRNPLCMCKCCQIKGRDRVNNSFDEIPVGKNPTQNPCGDYDNLDNQDSSDNILPMSSGVYFFDAEEKRFVRQEPRTPTPLIIQDTAVSTQPSTRQYTNPDLEQVIRCLPPRTKGKIQTPLELEPIVLPQICGDPDEIEMIIKNLQ